MSIRAFHLAAVLWAFACVGHAETIVVLGKGLVAHESMTLLPADAAFFSLTKQGSAFADPLPLSAPPEWGRTVPGATGDVQLHRPAARGLILKVRLAGLAPEHRYLLTLNGNPRLPGNDRLPDPVPGLPAERYFDFFTATTDKHGGYEATFGIVLPAGPYEVRFYVKDTDDFKIVLYHDYFPCAVE